jgi:hypothetical protein
MREEMVQWNIFKETLENDFEAMGAFAEENEEKVMAFARALNRPGEVSHAAKEEVGAFVQQLVQLILESEAAEERVDALADAMSDLTAEAHNVGLTTQSAVDEFAESLELMVDAASDSAEEMSVVFNAMAEQIVAFVDAARLSGVEIPEILLQMEDAARSIEFFRQTQEDYEDAVDEMEARAEQFARRWQRIWRRLGNSVTREIGDATASIIVDGITIEEAGKRMLKSIARQAISSLVQWAIQRFILSKLVASTTMAENAAQMAGAISLVYANSFSSAAAIPIIGWAMAPGIAAMNAGIAAAGAAAAGATGAALGAGTTAFNPMSVGILASPRAEGVIALSPSGALIGEAGPEIVLPLRGPQARRAARELGFEGGRGDTFIINATFTGDNWRDDGVGDELVERVVEQLNEQITLGKSLVLRSGTI